MLAEGVSFVFLNVRCARLEIAQDVAGILEENEAEEELGLFVVLLVVDLGEGERRIVDKDEIAVVIVIFVIVVFFEVAGSYGELV